MTAEFRGAPYSLLGPRWALSGAVLALLGVHAALAVWCAARDSVTVDEFAHLPSGITYLQTGDFKLYHQNPPLVKMLAALPALSAMPQVRYGNAWRDEPPSQWAFAKDFLDDNREQYFAIFFRARLVIVGLSVLGGILVFLWARDVFGPAAGVLGLALWCFCPNVLAHGHLVTTDMGATVLGFGATYFFWRYVQRPTWKRAWLAGFLLGAAQLTKFSPLILYLIWPAIWLIARPGAAKPPLKPRRSWKGAIQAATILAVSLFTINLGYGFQGSGLRLGAYEFACRMLTKPRPPGRPTPRSKNRLLELAWRERENRFRGTILELLPVPLPVHYVLGFDEQKLESEGLPNGEGYPVYLNGELRRTGWWYYYLATLAYKVPESTWLLGLLALGWAWRFRADSAGWRTEAILLLPIVATLVQMSAFTNICLGLRYVLPMFPYVFVSLGRLGRAFNAGPRWLQGVVAGALCYNLGAIAFIHPHELSYFNLVAGGPGNGSRHLIDSNLDWGQDLYFLGAWLDRHPEAPRPLGLLYFGNVDPHLLRTRMGRLQYELPPPLPPPEQLRKLRRQFGRIDSSAIGPRPGLFAVSVNFVEGLPYRVFDGAGRIRMISEASYTYFRLFRPIGQAGYSIQIYAISPAEAERARARLGLPPLTQ